MLCLSSIFMVTGRTKLLHYQQECNSSVTLSAVTLQYYRDKQFYRKKYKSPLQPHSGFMAIHLSHNAPLDTWQVLLLHFFCLL